MGVVNCTLLICSIMLNTILAVYLFALAQGSENNVHVSGYKAPTQVFAMPYGAYGAGSYGGYGAGYGGYGAGYGAGHGAGYGGYGSYGNLYGSAYAPVSSYSSAYAPRSSYRSAYAPVEHNSAYAPVSSYSSASVPAAHNSAYAPESAATYAGSDYSTGYGSYGLNYGSYAPKDGKLVSVIDRSHGYGNVKYSVPTPFLSNSAYGPAKH